MKSSVLFVVSHFILCLLLIIPLAILGILLTKKLYLENKNKNKPLRRDTKALQIAAICPFILTSFAGIILFIQGIYDAFNNFNVSITSTSYFIFHVIYIILMAMAYVSSYLFLVFRLYITFNDSVYKIKHVMVYIHIGIIIFTVLYGMVITIIGIYRLYNQLILSILFFLMILLIIIPLIHMIYSFNHRLFKLVLSQQQSIAIDHELSERQRNMLLVVRKHTLLGFFMILIDFIAILNYIIPNATTNGEYVGLSTYYVALSGYYIVFDVIMVFLLNAAGLCIYLGFTVNKNEYLLVCNYCDGKCETLCESMVKTKMFYGANDFQSAEL